MYNEEQNMQHILSYETYETDMHHITTSFFHNQSNDYSVKLTIIDFTSQHYTNVTLPCSKENVTPGILNTISLAALDIVYDFTSVYDFISVNIEILERSLRDMMHQILFDKHVKHAKKYANTCVDLLFENIPDTTAKLGEDLNEIKKKLSEVIEADIQRLDQSDLKVKKTIEERCSQFLEMLKKAIGDEIDKEEKKSNGLTKKATENNNMVELLMLDIVEIIMLILSRGT